MKEKSVIVDDRSPEINSFLQKNLCGLFGSIIQMIFLIKTLILFGFSATERQCI